MAATKKALPLHVVQDLEVVTPKEVIKMPSAGHQNKKLQSRLNKVKKEMGSKHCLSPDFKPREMSVLDAWRLERGQKKS